MENLLNFRGRATCFAEALPVGDGSLGAMVYGNLPNLTLTLNQDTLWSGGPEHGRKTVHVADETLAAVREYLRGGRYSAAQALVQERMLGSWTEGYLGAGTLTIHGEGACAADDLTRTLDMRQACAVSEGGGMRAESFVSFAEHVLLTRVTSVCPADFTISMTADMPFTRTVSGSILALLSQAPAHVEPNYVDSANPIVYGGGMGLCIVTDVAETDGRIQQAGDSLRVIDATGMTVRTVIRTGFRGWNQAVEPSAEKLLPGALAVLSRCAQEDWQTLKNRHLAVYQPMYDRVTLSLGDGVQTNLPVPERVMAMRQGGEDPGLYALLFQYGRYMMLCSSYPAAETTQPANLQGLWCEGLRPAWSCNWTTNINLEMNYWLTGPCGLTECEQPLNCMLAELAESGRAAARETCHAGGWTAFHNADIWRQTAPSGGEPKWAWWPMSGVWLATHLYRHYRYTGDVAWLRAKGWPLMQGAAQFCMDWLTPGADGWLHTLPSTSPENCFLDEQGMDCAVCDSSTMDRALIRELLRETLDAAEVLGIRDEQTEAMARTLTLLPEDKVGRWGQLQEWREDFPESDVHHRHMAHLVGLHPFCQITPDGTPLLAQAAAQTLRRRTEGLDVFVGWSEAWLSCFYARLWQGDEAQIHLRRFITDCTFCNLMSLHPPMGDVLKPPGVFQIDGNFGVTAAIADMLVQSHDDTVTLLCALPASWQEGCADGLMAEGGWRVSLRWAGGRLLRGGLTATRDGDVHLRYARPFRMTGEDGHTQSAVREKSGLYAVNLHGSAGACCVLEAEDREEDECLA